MKLEIPERPFEAYIFDCDGTLADTMPVHFRAWSRIMEEEGGSFPEDLFYSWGGRPPSEIIAELNIRCGLNMSVEETVSRKEGYYLEMLPNVEPVHAVLEIARQNYGRLPMAVASGGHRDVVLATLDLIGATSLFGAVVCAEDYDRGKPAPDPFLMAAGKLGVAPAGCLVFEDSPTGIMAAEAAGMAHVFVDTRS